MAAQTCRAPARLPPPGKAKPKAPLPPSERKSAEYSSFDDSEVTNFAMEQKENILDRDIELSVVLPGDVIKSTAVNGSKPMMDLLVYLCAQYRLNPSSHTIDLMSAEKKQIKFQPNTPIGMLEVDKVILKPKQMDKKKPVPVIPEQTVRVVVNYKKTQKTIVRVSPHAPLQELLPVICSKCDFDPLHTMLLKSYQSQDALDLEKSLNDLGLRELYAMDVSRVTPTTEFHLSSLQDTCQNSQNLDILKEKENKGFFGFFQRNKKKREQTASAPATPLMSKPRQTFFIRSNTVSKQYDSNTLPSEMPKKRRAPLPPMPASQSDPQDLAQAQHRSATCFVKSSSVDETEKGLSTVGRVRTGSLQLSGTSSVNSSLRRAKRKAPSPPPRKGQNENSTAAGPELAESIQREDSVKGRHSEVPSPIDKIVDLTGTSAPPRATCQSEPSSPAQNNGPQSSDTTKPLANADIPDESEVSLKSDIESEYSLEEIDEKEELHEESTDTVLRTQEVSTPSIAPHVPPSPGKTESASLVASDPGAGTEKTEKSIAYDKAQHRQRARTEVTTPENGNKCQESSKCLPLMTDESKVDMEDSNKLGSGSTSNCQTCQNEISQERNPQELLGGLELSNLEPVKTQDVAIQTIPSADSFVQPVLNENTHPQHIKQTIQKGLTHMHKSALENQPSEFIYRVHKTVGTLTEFSYPKQQAVHDRTNPRGDQNEVCANEDNLLPQRVVQSPVSSPTKSYPLYQQHSSLKPKPSNEITRDYIPKIGMTTYKIVPPKSLEILKNWESDTVEDQEAVCLQTSPQHENSPEFGTQTEICNTPNQTEVPGFRHEVVLPGNDLLHKTCRVGNNTIVSLSNAQGKKTGIEHSKPNPRHVIAPLALSTENKSFSPPAVREKSSILSPPAKPNTFYLQMQKRASSHYVTSAVARSSSVSSPTLNEAKSIVAEKKPVSPDQTSFPFPRVISVPSQPVEEKAENGHNDEKKPDVPTSPVKLSKPLNSPPSQPPPFNLKTIRTFLVPQPYSSSRPSPFALAVSSAVKRSQSFSKTCTSTSEPLQELSSVDLPSPTSNTEMKNHSPLQSPTDGSPRIMVEKENSCASSEQNRQVPSLSGHPATAVCEKGTGVTLQRPDPEQIHQSLLAAIRSGEAAAKLRRVGPPLNTVAVNGRSSLDSSATIEARYDQH
ncbi:cordon-bleu protein-like 1 isoform X2 [Eublepharis macularius]|uniref:Cordon-bleu protein-like 1 isoform X2 n=1 Tax=Eublepharis macularius TaxID=481883 RepID=A0AA97KR22_EUBMA|nr:cordon-bleu protein-like 1 isoform X2 [Eublepharis macularius]